MADSSSPVRVGVVGTGAISQLVHVPILAERSDVEVVALADSDPHKAEALSRRFDVPLVMDVTELIEYDALDAVVLCTPNALHEAQAIAALGAGLHVLVERPLALTPHGARRVLDAAESSGRSLTVGLPHRFRPAVVALRSFVAGGELGDVSAVRVSWLTRSAPSMRATWRQKRDIAGGGALMDLGIASLDLALWLVGYPAVKRVSCILDRHDGEVEEAATLTAETEHGAALSIEVSNRLFAGSDRYHARVMGTEGSGSLPPLQVYKRIGGRPMDATPRQPKPSGGENLYLNAYRRLLDHFVRCVAGSAEAEPPTEQVRLMEIVGAAYRAAESGREVTL